MTQRSLVPSAAVAVVFLAATVVARQTVSGPTPGTFIGPSSSQSPYAIPTSEGWTTTALLTVGDSVGSTNYVMAGIPDGLGALAGRPGPNGSYERTNDFMTVFMNHELGSGAGAVRAHGQTGAFVSEWVIELDTLRVTRGQDLIRNLYLWNGTAHVPSNGQPAAALARLCSADLPGPAAFDAWVTGTRDRILLNGEESGNEGRAFAHVVSGPRKGDSFELPHLGRMSFENLVARPSLSDTTVVVGLDDSTPGQVYVYVGEKRRQGNPVQKAGLEGGELYGVKVVDGGANYGNGPAPFESNGPINGRFVLEPVTDVATGSGANLQTTSRARGITEFARPEDGHWDTKNPSVFYFVVTGASVATPPGPAQSQTARLYRLKFEGGRRPTGGRIELVADSASLMGSDGQTARSFDNITVDGSGRVLMQEDPGNTSYIAKTWRLNPVKPDEAEQILESDRTRFLPGTLFLTQDEENSGIIDVTDLVRGARWFDRNRRYYLADTQAHYGLPSPLVEGGQLYLISSRRLTGGR